MGNKWQKILRTGRSPLVVLLCCLEVIALAPAMIAANPSTLAPEPQFNTFESSGSLLARRRYRPRRGRYFPRWGSPSWSRGGAARGGCSEKETPLIPLMPVLAEGDREPGFFGVTFSTRPTFFAYVPETTAREVEFLLLDEQHTQDVIYEKKIPITGKPQIISFTLDTDKQLVPERNYKWYFTTLCDPNDTVLDDNSGNPSISGLVEMHIPESLAGRPTNPNLKVADSLAQQGAWIDALSMTAKLQCLAPSNPTVNAAWRDLLADMELEKIPALAKRLQKGAIATAPLPCNQIP